MRRTAPLRSLLGAVLSLSFLLLACQDDVASTEAPHDEGGSVAAPDAGAADSSPAADGAPVHETWDTCSDLDEGAPVAQEKGVGALPEAAGGVLVDGRYVLARVQVYGASNLTSDQESLTIRLASGTVALRRRRGSTGGEYTASGSELKIRFACACNAPTPVAEGSCSTRNDVSRFPYTAGPDSLALHFDYINGGTEVLTFRRE